MARFSRFICVVIPLLFTLASLICLAMLFAAGSSPGNLHDVAYFKADLSNFTNATVTQLQKALDLGESVSGVDIDAGVLDALNAAKEAANIQDGYSIGLWNYCSGPVKDGNFEPNFCSDKGINFYFNPIEIWHLNNTAVQSVLPSELVSAIDIYRKASHWNIILHIISISLVAFSFVFGFFATCSKVMSFLISTVMFTAAFFTAASAIATSVIYGTITSAFKATLDVYGVQSTLGSRGFALIWLAFAFAFAAFLCWTVTICCCSTKSWSPTSNHTNRRGMDGHVYETPLDNRTQYKGSKKEYQPV